jgi:hypothetical protein
MFPHSDFTDGSSEIRMPLIVIGKILKVNELEFRDIRIQHNKKIIHQYIYDAIQKRTV